MSPPDPAQTRKLREEEAKLTAGWLNGVSLAFGVIGVIQPLGVGRISVASVAFLIAAGGLHYGARLALKRLFPRE